jgi:hypothetical protein
MMGYHWREEWAAVVRWAAAIQTICAGIHSGELGRCADCKSDGYRRALWAIRGAMRPR